MKEDKKREWVSGQEEAFEPAGDGMSSLTAKLAINHELRKQLMNEYDVVGLHNRGRYYDAVVQTKDGHWTLQLLIDKQSGDVQVVSKKEGT